MKAKFALLALIPLIVVIGIILAPTPNQSPQTAPQVVPQEPKPEAPKPEPQQPQVVVPMDLNCRGTARCFLGEVKKIVDGDTLDIGEVRVRLTLVNTPERGEQGYREATDFTAKLCPVGSKVVVDEDDRQKEGSFDRIVALVYCSTKNLNAELLANGHAKILSEFCSKSEFADEAWAKSNGC
ncbi:MAG: thermonuclease family protein [Thaumarchaeota archaeon]|nr:thermonuclease family protein [Nitrososphaerota archaeon]